ncbi:UNVERIFIED_CONTAM: hypothetical protein FKN15_026036 [Acipenser sinensis]
MTTAEDARKLKGWFLENAGLEAQSLPMVVRTLWMMDSERWEAFQQEHTPNNLEEGVELVLSYLEATINGTAAQVAGPPAEGEYLLSPSLPAEGEYLLSPSLPAEGEYLLSPSLPAEGEYLLSPSLPAEGEYLLSPSLPAEGEYLLSPSLPAEGEYLLSPSPPAEGECLLVLPPQSKREAQKDKEVKDREEECRLRARHPRRFNKPSPGCLLCDQDHLFANCPFRSYEEEPERPQPKREEPERSTPEWEESERPTPEWEEPERPTPEWEEPERPTPEWEEPERPTPEWEEPERPTPEWEEPERPTPEWGEPVRPQPKREESVRPQPKREESVRPQPKEREVGASTALGPKLPAEGECLLVPPPPAEEQCLLSPSTPAEEQGLLSQCPPAEEACLLVHLLLPPQELKGEEPSLPSQEPEGEELQAPPPENFWGGEGQDAGVPQQPLFMLLKAARRTPAQPPQQGAPAPPQPPSEWPASAPSPLPPPQAPARKAEPHLYSSAARNISHGSNASVAFDLARVNARRAQVRHALRRSDVLCFEGGRQPETFPPAHRRSSLQAAGVGFILIIDRRQDKWTSVKGTLLRIAIKVPLDLATERLAAFTDPGNCTTHVEHILRDLSSHEEKTCEVLDQAKDLASEGDQLIQNNHYAVDSILPKCNELRRVTEDLASEMQLRKAFLHRCLELHQSLEKAAQWCDEGIYLLASQPVDKCQSQDGAQSALQEIERFLEAAADNKLHDLDTITSDYESILNQEFSEHVRKVLQKQEGMQEMFEKRRVSLKKLAAKQTRPVQPVAPRPEAFSKSPHSSPGLRRGSENTFSPDKDALCRLNYRKGECNESRTESMSEEEENLSVLRRHVMNELIETERAYVEELLCVLEGYAAEMDNPVMMHLIPAALQNKKEILFGNMTEIYQFHNRIFLRELENYIHYPELVGRCFLERMKDLQIYEKYCHNKPRSESLWRQCSDCVFFQELLKYSKNCDGSEDLQDALTAILGILKAVNDSMHLIAITGYDGNLNDLGKLLMQGSFNVWTEHKKGHSKVKDLARFKPMQRHLFLHQKALLFCKKREENGEGYEKAPSYSFKHYLNASWMSAVGITENAKGDYKKFEIWCNAREEVYIVQMSAVGITENAKGDYKKFEIWCNAREEVYIVQAPTPEIKTAWVNEIRKVLTGQLNAYREASQQKSSEQVFQCHGASTPISSSSPFKSYQKYNKKSDEKKSEPASPDSCFGSATSPKYPEKVRDEATTSPASERSAVSKKRFTLQGFSNLKNQKGSPTSPDNKAKRHEIKSDPTPFGFRGSPTSPDNKAKRHEIKSDPTPFGFRVWGKASQSLDASEENDGYSSAEDPLNSSDAEEEAAGKKLSPGKYTVVAEYDKGNTDDLTVKSGEMVQLIREGEDGQCGVIKAFLGTKHIDQSNMKGIEVVQKIQHENYNRTHSNDIMLLKLKKPTILNNNIHLLGLPENNDDVKPGTLCNVAGWGQTLTLLYSPTLQEVNVTVIDRETCNSKDYYNHNPTITEDLLCACNKTGGGDACQGDSGGPLVCEGVFRGIVSGGEGCGLAKKPGIYVNLNKKYVTWIKEKIRRHNHREESGNQASEEVSKCLVAMKEILYGTNEKDPQTETVAQLAQELYNSGLLLSLVNDLQVIDFEGKKDVCQIFNNILRRQIGTRIPTVEYISSHQQILFILLKGSDFIHSEDCYLLAFFNYVEMSTFDIASDAFATFKDLLTRHKVLVAEYLEQNYDAVFSDYEKLLHSENYVTKRQSLKLLGELLLDRHNFTIMTKYISKPENLKLMMNLLRDKSPNIQFEAFHVFKVFVANPNKTQPIVDILLKNQTKLIEFLSNFQKDRTDDEQFNDEKTYLIKQIRDLKKPAS